ncbi:RNA polymerase sigma factor ShbA [Micromonospora sp. 15K316]|uniref:sigma factor-like helix-turn-helix DNA-binding protein n=1 Tax=Micromonospora sp. 15K316 TaxID=2530376 RepID=UPI00104961CD|nr:sigma factor-like helix-turn-helix DNA-binding protein [Micromonospora sp. 15K316]TDC37605.1 RNA polymerase sigma factor ShbA [Micromonospora sp. 15K316]
MMTTSADPQLVRRAARGDRVAAATLLADVRPGLIRYCRARLGRAGDTYAQADALADEICLAVLRDLPRLGPGMPFPAFVHGIALRLVAEARPTIRGVAAESPAEGPPHRTAVADPTRRLAGLLGLLSEAQREILVLRVAVGLTAEQVGTALGISAAAVRLGQSRALARLRTLPGSALGVVAA